MKQWAKQFYASDAWHDTRQAYLESKLFLCERCSTDNSPVPATIAHHKIWLNERNINDPAIALSHANLEVLCQDCHNKEHHNKKPRVCYRWDSDGNINPSPPQSKK